MNEINNEKIIVISDTHLGSEKANLEYLQQVYEFAASNNIKHILHAGDLMHSTMKNVLQEFINPLSQIRLVVEKYPRINNIKTHILLGNHDHHLLNKNDEYKEILSKRSDFDLLGYKKAYIKWQDNTISLIHHSYKNNIKIHNIDTLIDFYGHHHSFKIINQKSFYIPTLSDDIKEYDDTHVSEPGFIVATIQNDTLLVELKVINKEIEHKGFSIRKILENNN